MSEIHIVGDIYMNVPDDEPERPKKGDVIKLTGLIAGEYEITSWDGKNNCTLQVVLPPAQRSGEVDGGE